jgi:hypothetical protein
MNVFEIPTWLLVAVVGAVILTLAIVGAIVIAVGIAIRNRRDER